MNSVFIDVFEIFVADRVENLFTHKMLRRTNVLSFLQTF